MEIANRWADGEESVRGDRGRSPRNDDDKSDRRKRQKTMFVAAEYTKGRNSGYHGNREWKSKVEEKPMAKQLDEYCTIHAYRDKQTGELKANHTLRNCRKMQEYSQAMSQTQQQAVSRGYPMTPGGGAIAYGAPPPPQGSTREHDGSSTQSAEHFCAITRCRISCREGNARYDSEGVPLKTSIENKHSPSQYGSTGAAK